MESSRYWQDFGGVRDRIFRSELAGGGLSPACPTREKGDGGKIIYDGRLISVDVYLALPTFVRRGIAIAV